MELPLWKLESIASLEEQRRYMVRGTKDEYLLPEEALEHALEFCERAASPELSGVMTANQRDAILQLSTALTLGRDVLDGYTHATLEVLVEANPRWSLIRAKAASVLAAFEYRLGGE